MRQGQSALAALSKGQPGDGPSQDDLREFLSGLPELWRSGEARPAHRKEPTMLIRLADKPRRARRRLSAVRADCSENSANSCSYAHRNSTLSANRISIEPTRARHWRTREDPFARVWTDILMWLQSDPDCTAKSIPSRLAENFPETPRPQSASISPAPGGRMAGNDGADPGLPRSGRPR